MKAVTIETDSRPVETTVGGPGGMEQDHVLYRSFLDFDKLIQRLEAAGWNVEE